AELAESEQRYRLVADAANDAIWDWEVASDQIRWNEGVRTNFGYAMQDVQSNTRWWSERIHPDDVEQVLADVHRHLESDSDTWQGEYRFRRADGTYAYVFDRGRIVRNADRRPLRMVGSMLDLTLRRQAEQDLARLLAEEKRHAALLNRVAAAARLVNSILSAESIARIVAEEASSILGASAAMTTWIAASDAQQHVVAADSATDDLDSQLTARVCKDNQPLRISSSEPGQRSCARLAVPLAAHGGKNLGAVQLARRDGRDFSSEDELVLQQLAAVASAGIENARLYEQVREQDRRKDEFLATLAHELRNPLAPIRTGLSVLRLAPPEERLAPEILEVMERQVEHMVRLIDDLLDVSRITRGMVELKRGHVEIRKIFDAAIEVSRSIIEAAEHQLIVSIPDEPLVIDADATRMAQVISNLLNNAAKYTPHGGRIELSAQPEGHELTILVRDNGTGIAPEMLSKVFEMFTQVGHTLELAQGGLGIGLGLVSKLVAMHGGTVTAQSDGLDQGSLFTVRLPLAVGESTGTDVTRSGSTTTPSQVISRRILVVDDNTDGAQVLSLLLERAGHTTSMAHNGRTALEVARQFRPEVVFLDIGLPEMNGYEVAQRLRAEYGSEDLTLVALTGWGTEADRRRSRDAGFDHHFTKPVDAAHVQAMLAGL
ncbi:MAG: ATP-binding protein, partial [Planctomycetaceae bacterium]